MSNQEWADLCISDGTFTISRTRMTEHSRTSEGEKWCFRCRTRAEFERVVTIPAGLSYYGPNISIDCTNCGAHDSDLFPGYFREWEEI